MLATILTVVALSGGHELNDDTFAKWRDFIRPKAEESEFLAIPWREAFVTAVNEASETNRPILLWAMNGHPLGCT